MDRNAALLFIGIDPSLEADAGQVEIALEDAVFREASFFMQRALIPKLLNARIARLEKIINAAATLDIKFEAVDHDRLLPGTDQVRKAKEFSDLLKAYNQAETQIKLQLANAEDPGWLIDVYRQWRELFAVFRSRFLELFENKIPHHSRLEQPEFSITRPADFNELIAEIKTENFNSLVFKEYLRLRKLGD